MVRHTEFQLLGCANYKTEKIILGVIIKTSDNRSHAYDVLLLES